MKRSNRDTSNKESSIADENIFKCDFQSENIRVTEKTLLKCLQRRKGLVSTMRVRSQKNKQTNK